MQLRKSFTCPDLNSGPRTGTPVKVRGGAFCGHTGFIEERRPNRLALVWIEVLGQLVRVEIDPHHLDVLN
jgi:hypothetical protein